MLFTLLLNLYYALRYSILIIHVFMTDIPWWLCDVIADSSVRWVSTLCGGVSTWLGVCAAAQKCICASAVVIY